MTNEPAVSPERTQCFTDPPKPLPSAETLRHALDRVGRHRRQIYQRRQLPHADLLWLTEIANTMLLVLVGQAEQQERIARNGQEDNREHAGGRMEPVYLPALQRAVNDTE